MAGLNIGDLVMRVLADMKDFDADLQKQAEKSGDKAGATLGQRMGAALKTNGVKVLGTAVAGGLAIAAAGAAKLTEIQNRFQAETGASAAEAAAAAKTINRVAGEERQSLEDVAAVAVIVKRDLGLTGDEAAKATQQLVRFSRVTGQDATEAAKAFDDILDAWGLSAADLGITMDKLLVSQHKFGGDLNETEATLSALAPSMRAANFEIDDGIALLGLFGSKGLDAGQASAAFAKALTKVKSPEELKTLIDDISKEPDAFKRAGLAADLFGAKAGAKLANALAGANLDDYRISVEEAAGATDKAADLIDSSVGNRIAKAFSIAAAKLREFGADFGPAATGLASIVTLAGTFGGGTLFKKMFAGFGGNAAVELGKKTGAKLVGGVTDAVTDGVGRLVLSSKLNAGLSAVGKFMGSTIGKAAGVAFAAVAIVELIQTFQDVKDRIAAEAAELASQTQSFVQQATLDALVNARKGVAEQLKAMGSDPIAEALGLSAKKGIEETLASLDAEIQKRTTAIFLDETASARQHAEAMGEATIESYAKGLDGPAAGSVNTAANSMVARAKAGLAQANAAFHTAGIDGVTAFAKGILDSQDKVKTAVAALEAQMQTEMSRSDEQAYLVGVLTSKELAKGLSAGRQGVREQALELQRQALDRLEVLVRNGQPLGKKAAQALKDGLHSKNGTIRKEAEHIKSLIEKNSTTGQKPGKDSGQHIADGLGSKKGAVARQAYILGLTIGQRLLAGLVDDLGSNRRGYTGNEGHATGGPETRGRPRLVGEFGPELFVPYASGYTVPHNVTEAIAAGAGSGGDTNITVALPTPPRASGFEVARQLRRLADLHVLEPRL